MKDFPKRQLLINYLRGLCIPSEEKEVERWLDEKPENSALLQELAKEMAHEGDLSSAEKADIKHQVFEHIEAEEKDSGLARKKERLGKEGWLNTSAFARYGFRLKVAAAAILIISVGLASWYSSSQKAPIAENPELTFKKRTLSAGQKATFRFGDGSVIELNSESTLRYPTRFGSGKREVYLEGEAYFSVERDTTRPFIVHAGGTTTRVLGTAFNIRAYETEDRIQVAVTEGEVAVSREETGDSTDQETVHVTKNEWVTYHSTGRLIEAGEGDIREMVAWKDKVLIFNDKTLSHIAGRLERWYNIDIELAEPSLVNRRMSVTFEDESLTEVLTTISLSLNIEYKRDGQQITFQNKK